MEQRRHDVGIGRGERSAATYGRVLRGALVLLSLVGCSQFDVTTRQDPSVDFGRMRTFAWLPIAEAEPADQRTFDRTLDPRVRAATEAQLRKKGYSPAGSEPADFLLNYRLSTNPSEVLHAAGRGYVAGLWTGWPGADHVYDTHDVGTLYLAALDRETKHMFWVGAARARMLGQISYEKRVKRANAAIEKILASFPKR